MKELYLVTGAAGHLGSALLKELHARGKQVRALVLKNEPYPPNQEQAEIFYGDICDEDSLDDFFTVPPDTAVYVIHAAGIVSISSKYDQRVYDVNVKGTRNVVDLCKKHAVKKLVHVSSVHAIPEQPKGQVIREVCEFDPQKVVGLYAKTKAAASQLVLDAAKEEGLNACIVHPSGILGPYDHGRGHLTAMVIDYCKGALTACVDGGYDFVDVRDVAKGIFSCCKKGQRGECYILSNQYYDVQEILQDLHEITGKRNIKRILPHFFVKWTAPLAEAYYKLLKRPPLFTAYSLETLHANAWFSHEKASEELEYQPRPIRETLEDTVAWLKENHRI